MAEIADVVVREHADVRPRHRERRQVGRVHPVVHLLAWREVAARGHAGFQVDDSHVGLRLGEDGQGVPPRPRRIHRPRHRPVCPLGQAHVVEGVVKGLPGEPRVTGVGKDLVHPAAEHHVATEEQRQPLVHPFALRPNGLVGDGRLASVPLAAGRHKDRPAADASCGDRPGSSQELIRTVPAP
jgi:hypothetical protein